MGTHKKISHISSVEFNLIQIKIYIKAYAFIKMKQRIIESELSFNKFILSASIALRYPLAR